MIAKKPAEVATNSIIHEVNVSHSIDCSPRARYHILKQCIILDNKSKANWSELKYWMNRFPDAPAKHIRIVMDMLENGKDVRGFEVEEDEQ
jgi:hypothetical protein